VLLLFLWGGAAVAADVVFRHITWPRHDRQTGLLEWELRARTASPRSSNEYACSYLRLFTYKAAAGGGVPRSRKDMYLEADKGMYVHGTESSRAKLIGDVEARFYGADPIRIETDEATLKSTWDKETGVKTRVIVTESKVVVSSPTRTLTGRGMTVFDRVDPGGRHDGHKSQITLERDVEMLLRDKGMADPFPAMSASGPGEAGPARDEPVRVSCFGPLVFDRLANRAIFHNQVAVRRGGTTLHCGKLTLTFAEPAAGREGETPEMKLETMLAEEKVVIAGEEQRLSGETFTWDPGRAVGTLTGAPATMTAPDTTAWAEEIRYDQKAQRVEYVGNAEVEIELREE